MKLAIRTLVAVAALVFATAATASAAGVTVGVNAGIQSYTGDAGEGWKSGVTFGATGDYMLNEQWSVGVNLGFTSSKHDDDGVEASTLYPGLSGTISDELKVTQYGAHVRWFLPVKGTPVHPYAVAGLGMYGVKAEFSAGSYSEDASDTKFGERLGAGATWMLNPMVGINAEADYHMVQTEGESTNFYGLRGGVTFNLNAK